jgi:imidazolonepropionase-like amidohydrolase
VSNASYRNLSYWDGFSDQFRDADIHVQAGIFTADAATDSIGRDMAGGFAIPGLIDAHVHMCLNPKISDPLAQADADDDQILEEIRARALAMVRAGITTARDLGGGAWLELRIRDEIMRGDTPGPRLICAGQPITSVGGHCHFWGGQASNTEQALTVLARQCEHGSDLIKVMVTGGNITPGSTPKDSQFEDEVVVEIVRESLARERHVAAHCHGTDGIRQAAAAGVRTVEHCSWVGDTGWGRALDENVVKMLADNKVWVSPTINAGWRRFRKPEFVDMVRENYRRMKAAGVKLIASTDAGIPNVFHHDLPKALPEFARFADLTSRETLVSATSDCADAIGLGSVTGKIETGYSADFVVYETNPLEDLSVLEHPQLVVVQGREQYTT